MSERQKLPGKWSGKTLSAAEIKATRRKPLYGLWNDQLECWYLDSQGMPTFSYDRLFVKAHQIAWDKAGDSGGLSVCEVGQDGLPTEDPVKRKAFCKQIAAGLDEARR
jgi:hypothetical protein